MAFDHTPTPGELAALQAASTHDTLIGHASKVVYFAGVALRDVSKIAPRDRNLQALLEVIEATYLGAASLLGEMQDTESWEEDLNAI